jgi:hypothetical protein
MIPKGNQRGGGRQLATHLLNQFDNDRVEVLDLRGAVAQDLHGAFHEWYAQSKATKCRKFLYSLSVNPDLAKYDLTREQYLDFIARTERSLNLVGQPRAVVFHTKNGREHCHTVWSRIDPDAAKAVHIDHDRFKLQAVAREFARDHGLTLPPGMRKNGRSNKDKESNYQEKQQQERSGISKEERTKAITAVWQEHNKDPHAFVKALEEKGYHLANGDSGRYVVIDHAGEVHSLYRQIEGTRSNEVKAFLGADYPLDKLRDVETARTAALQGKKEQAVGKEEPQARPEDDAAGKREQEATARREELARRHEERRSQLDLKRAEMEKRMGTERAALLDLHTAEKDGVLAARAEKQPRGMIAFLSRITGIQAYITARHGRQDAAREQAHKADREALDRRHGRDRQEMERRYASLAAVETRERQSLAIALKRQEFQKAREIIAGSRVLPESQLKPEFDRAVNPAEARQGEGDSRAAKGEQLLHDFENAADPQKAGQTTGDSGKSPKGRLAGLFSRVAQPFTKGDLQRAFERAKDPERKPASEQQERAEEIDPEKLEQAAAAPDRLEQARKTKADLERRQREQEPPPPRDRDPGDRGR